MAGAWLIAVARALTTRDTFERIAAPAIADLQHEAQDRRHGSWRAYAAAWTTLARAIAYDFGADAGSAFDTPTRRRVRSVSAWTLVLLVVAPRLWAMLELGVERRTEWLPSVVSIPSSIVAVLPVIALPVAAVIAGRRHGRTILLMAGATALSALLFQAAVIPRIQPALRAAARAAVPEGWPDGAGRRRAAGETIGEYVDSTLTGQPFGPVFLDEPYTRRRAVDRASGLAATAAALGFALCGAALRFRRDWAIVAVTLPIYAAYVWLGSFSLVWMSGLGFHPAFRAWLPTLAIVTVGILGTGLRLVVDRRSAMAGTR